MKDNSLHDRMQGNWKQLKGGVRHEWGKLTHNDVEETKGYVEALAGKIEERYGVTKAGAKKQIDQWTREFKEHQTEKSNSNTSGGLLSKYAHANVNRCLLAGS